MNKRKPLDPTTTDELTKDLKVSNGAGMNAFFPSVKTSVLPAPSPKTASDTPDKILGEIKLDTHRPERTNDRPNVRTNERMKTRHSFDIFKDQLDALMEIQYKATKKGKKKPALGQLVQEAIDAYLIKVNERPNVRTNEQMDVS